MQGKTFGDFTIVKLIGQGNMGKVYLAIQNSLEREVAIKIIGRESFSSDAFQRFIREGKVGASLQHPNIVNIYSVGQEQSFAYIAMEYIRGESLESKIKEKPLSEGKLWEYGLQLASGLQSLLEQNVIHRDIKPANILITDKNSVKLTDFGLSKRIDDQNLTHTGLILGTPNYMSPEQASGDQVDFRSDIYSLGVTLYQAITGHLPFAAKSIADVIYKHKYEIIDNPLEYVPTLRKESCYIICRMLHKKAEDRYQNYSEIIADIMELARGYTPKFASKADVAKISRNVVTKTGRKTSRLFSVFRNLFSTDEKTASDSLFVVVSDTAQEVAEHLKKYTTVQLQAISMLEDLTTILDKKPAYVLLDTKFLGPNIVRYFDELRYNYPKTPVFIKGLLPKSGDNKDISILPYFNDPDKTSDLFSKAVSRIHYLAKHLTLQMPIYLAYKGKWDAILEFRSGNQLGAITFVEGEIIHVTFGNLQGKAALDSMLKKTGHWKIQSNVKEVYATPHQSRIFETAYRQRFLENFPVYNLLQLVEMEYKSCILKILPQGGGEGYICCRNGVVYDAVLGSFEGEEAFTQIIALDDCRCSVEKLPTDKIKKNINKPLYELILEALHQKDSREDETPTNKVPEYAQTIVVSKPENSQEKVETRRRISLETSSPQSTGIIKGSVCDSFGKYLVEKGILPKEMLEKALMIQKTINRKIGQVAVDEGVLGEEQVSTILRIQRNIKKPFGDLAVEMELLTPEKRDLIIQKQQSSYLQLYDIILNDNMVSKDLLEKELEAFQNL